MAGSAVTGDCVVARQHQTNTQGLIRGASGGNAFFNSTPPVAIANLGNLEMKKVLLGTTALLGAGLVASPAFAADGIKLGVGGFFKEAYMVVFDDDSEGKAWSRKAA